MEELLVIPTLGVSHDYFDDVETREDGGTPAFLQTIRIALSVQLKEKNGNRYDKKARR